MTEPHNHVSAESCDLKPCPFCGTEAKLVDASDSRIGYFVRCEYCQLDYTNLSTPEKAAALWNCRVHDVAQPTRESAVIAAIDPFTRGAFTGWMHKSGDDMITLDEAEDHFSLCMADMMEAAREAASQPSPAAPVEPNYECSCQGDPNCPNPCKPVQHLSAASEPVNITGWKLVPDDPTEAMWQAGRSADLHPGDSYSKVWRAMFDAAPNVDDCETISHGAQPQGASDPLETLEGNCWDLRCIDIPTGGGDADIGWNIVEHHMAPPKERIVGTGRSPREALQDATSTLSRPTLGPALNEQAGEHPKYDNPRDPFASPDRLPPRIK